MNNHKETMTDYVEQIFDRYIDFVIEDNQGHTIMIDPLDNKAIGHHYSMTHFGVALIIHGMENSNIKYVDIGKRLIRGFISNYEEYTAYRAYHWDFNNFALCVLEQYLAKRSNESESVEFCQVIRKVILSSSDSRHNTINWLPMRIYVNNCRYHWTSDKRYKKRIDDLLQLIKKAQNQDGFYEDLLPKGTSFNFQYHTSTAALISFLNTQGFEIDNSDAVYAALKIIDPEGDFNYLGRGTNQIFGWGPYLYLLHSINNEELFNRSNDYFRRTFSLSLKNNNLILNEYSGEEKKFWWDYHFASVYFGHLAFWLVLAEMAKVKSVSPNENRKADSGIEVFRDKKYFTLVFTGRKHYLAEKGPAIYNLWTEKTGTIFKGPFGPFFGDFGNLYSLPVESMLNYFGPVSYKRENDGLDLRIIFPQSINVIQKQESIVLVYTFKRDLSNVVFNLPVMNSDIPINDLLKVTVADKAYGLVKTSRICGPYGDVQLYQTRQMSGRRIEVEIRL